MEEGLRGVLMGTSILAFCMAMLFLHKIGQDSVQLEESALWKEQNQKTVYVYELEERI